MVFAHTCSRLSFVSGSSMRTRRRLWFGATEAQGTFLDERLTTFRRNDDAFADAVRLCFKYADSGKPQHHAGAGAADVDQPVSEDRHARDSLQHVEGDHGVRERRADLLLLFEP